MKAAGANLILIDCDPDYAAWWNRWYDMDHLAEFLGLPGVVAARRYVASDELRRTRVGADAEGLGPTQAAYCTIVFVGPRPEDAVEGRAGMAATHNRLMGSAGRMPDWDRISPRYVGGFDLAGVAAARSVRVGHDALLHLAHRGVLVELFDAEDQAAAAHWLDTVHMPRLLEAPGALAAARFRPAPLPAVEAPWEEEAPEGPSPGGARLFVLLLVEPDPDAVSSGLKEHSDSTLMHRPPPPGMARSFHGVFRSIAPLNYDFLAPEHGSGG